MTHKRHLSRRNRLKREIAQLRKLAFAPPEHSKIPDSDYLEIERDSVIRARVLLDCALLEETAALIIMDHVLTDCPKWNEIKYFGRIKRYYIFYDDILGRLPARHKIAVVKKFIRVPKAISKIMERMLALRDLFAHVRTLDYNKRRDLDYKGHNILSKKGVEAYLQDSTDVVSFLIGKTKIL
jgi:hypothetical protein